MSEERDIDALRASMQERADAECREIEQKAKERMAEIRRRSEADCERLRTEAMERLEREVRVVGERKRAEVALAERLKRLAVKQSVVEEVFALASKELDQPTGAESLPVPYDRLIESLAREAVHLLPGGGSLTVSKSDAEVAHRVAAEFGDSVVVEQADLPRGSVVARSAHGFHTIDNSIATRLRRGRTELMPLVSAGLFADAEDREGR